MSRTLSRNTAVRYAMTPCSLGWLLVAATERGICQTSLADSPEALQKRLTSRFPQARLDETDPQLAAWVEQFAALVEAPGTDCTLPLDIEGTDFQRKVWNALRAIPAGETASYAEIARRVGHPKAVRAVGNACGSNPVFPIVPCHRVLASDGSLGGFGYGLECKRELLARERSSKAATSDGHSTA